MKRMFSILTVLLGFCMISNAQDAQPVKPNPKAPVISFEKTVHDFGEIIQGDNGECEFVFKNTGKEPLIITNVRSSCGCTVAQKPEEPIMPGKKSSIKVRYDTNRIGVISKTVTVTSNATEPEINLQLKGNVSPKPVEEAPANDNSGSPVLNQAR
jgi:hypothetical protein